MAAGTERASSNRMGDNLNSATQTNGNDQPTLHEADSDLTDETPYRVVPAGLGAHFRTNPPWQVRRAGWRLFVQGS